MEGRQEGEKGAPHHPATQVIVICGSGLQVLIELVFLKAEMSGHCLLLRGYLCLL